jgi:hypothetical protein
VPVPDGISASLPPPYTGLKHLTKKVQTEAEYAEAKARFLAVIAGALADRRTDYVNIHTARPGCFLCRVERV